ncbi:hypothetical protein [Streptomyces boninensis]|uniref:hypothetical protein n=1 Tax=Streptomyces boninensis TaxID=2039455 RepID=UPI003B20CF9A
MRSELSSGPGRLLVTLYGVFAVGATSRAIYQLSTQYDEAPLAYVLSAIAAAIYVVILIAFVRGGERARKLALVLCAIELAGVLGIGTWTLVEPSAFPDQTVWSDYGMGYLFLPLIVPVIGLWWLSRQRRPAADARDPEQPSPA